MKKTTIISTLALAVACAASATAADTDGSLTLGGSYANIHGQKAKANEYRAIGSGAYGGLDLTYRDPEYFLDVNGNMVIVDERSADAATSTDNNFMIKGGMTNVGKLSLFYNEIPHNITDGARTYFNGVGTSFLTAPTAAPSATTVFGNQFDYSTVRTNYGAETELSLKSPFFFTARGEQTTQKGLAPIGFYTNLREVPAPVDYTTDTLNLSTGYRSDRLIVLVDGVMSNFSNNSQTMLIQQGAAVNTTLPNTAYLPPDNKFYKIGGSLTYRNPFWDTAFMVRGSSSILNSNPVINEQISATSRVNGGWNGNVYYNTASVALTTKPIKPLDIRLFYNFSERLNDGGRIGNTAYNGTAGGGTNNPVGNYGYHKQDAGIDLSVKLPAATTVSTGYTFAQIDRSSFWTWANPATLSTNATAGNPQASKTTDNIVFVQAKNTLLDAISGKVRYEHLFRDSDFRDLGLYARTSRALYFREYESADKGMDAIKVELESEVMHGLDLGVQYAFKLNNYKDTTFGMQRDSRHDIYADATYTAGIAKLNVYGELEFVQTNYNYYAGTIGPQSATNFSYTSKVQNRNYAVGSNLDVDVIKDRLALNLGYRYDNADGSNDFTNTFMPVIRPINVSALDDYTKHSLNAKLTYFVSKNLSLDLKYLYEHLKYADDAYAGYSNYVNVSATTNYALSGAYNNPNYDLSVFYLGMNYKF